MSTYQPKQGDIVVMNFNPQAGHEQGGRRPALVISNASFHRYTHMAIVCPITSKTKDYPMHVPLDERTRTQGEILCEHVKSLDYQCAAQSAWKNTAGGLAAERVGARQNVD